jgi:hypothetical protein
MADISLCPDCGAENGAVRRCRVCAALLDASLPETVEAVDATGPGPDPLLGVASDLPEDASAGDIAAATSRALREDRLRRRPGFLDRVFKGDGGTR